MLKQGFKVLRKSLCLSPLSYRSLQNGAFGKKVGNPGNYGMKFYLLDLASRSPSHTGKDPDDGKDRWQEEKGATEDEMVE